MRNLGLTSFRAIFQTEVVLNSKRIAPYAMAILFSANAFLWWGWGPAVGFGWATNGDFFIGRNFVGFSLITLPFFTAFFMGDVVIRDFRLGINPLIFSKPIARATYLLGKFLGNYFVFVCCQLAFALTLILLQGFRTEKMIVQPARVTPYLKGFIVSVVITHLLLAVFYFTVGTLTLNSKIVYALAVFFYPIYFAYNILLLKGAPRRWQVILDPILTTSLSSVARKDWSNAEMINRSVSSLGSDMIANRALTILLTAICLTILCVLFTRKSGFEFPGGRPQATLFGLSASRDDVYSEDVDFRLTQEDQNKSPLPQEKTALPEVETASEGLRAHLKMLTAALSLEFRLLRAERSLILLAPLAVFLSTMELMFYRVNPVGSSYSVAYASSAAGTMLMILLGLSVFYTGEAMHRDRETRVEPILWSFPTPNLVLLLSKYLSMLLLSLALIVVVGGVSIALQFLKGDSPVELQAYLRIYILILIPSVAFAIGVSVALNVLLRDEYLCYAVSLALGGGLYYAYSQGYNHLLYNFMLYQRWTYPDLSGASGRLAPILIHRMYCIAILCFSLSLAHIFYPRKSESTLRVGGRLGGSGWSIVTAILSMAIAAVAGAMIFTLEP